jgi:hypothetical protein
MFAGSSGALEETMYQFCITIGGKKHCFPVPSLIDRALIKRPPPQNFPPFELAVAVLDLVSVVPNSELSKQLAEVATHFIQQVQKGLPQGVELVQEQAASKAA